MIYELPDRQFLVGGTSTTYSECNWSRYTNTDQSACVECQPEYPGATYRSPSINHCLRVCMGGTYMANPTDTKCTEVEPGFWAPLHIYYYGHDATTDGTLHKCPDGTMTLGGIGITSNSVSDCAHTLHIGDGKMRVVGNKNTTPALAVLIDGKTYYARMSTDSHTISVDSPQKLRIGLDGVNYYVFDDTIATRAPYPWESADYN